MALMIFVRNSYSWAISTWT